jgi:CubicO group peptidase (beta-lactamase class C family)
MSHRTASTSLICVLVGVLAGLALQPASISYASSGVEYQAIANAAPKPLPRAQPLSAAELTEFIDGTMAIQLDAKPAAGATISVVKDGALLLAKGYGYADVEKRAPVDPEQTLFRPGSTSKLFTWTAVMQLVEQGKLDLDADVNTYLKDFQIPATHPEPVTLRNLLTHTAGFEDGGLGYLIGRSEKELAPLGDFLELHMPARARPPTKDFASGINASYSNWGTALAGHIVATVSGMEFDEYIERNIYQPLGMTSSSFREPLPPGLRERMSQGYRFKNGEFEANGFEFIHNFGPAGSMSTTAADMAKFMLAHLNDGALGEARILKTETAQLMHARTLSPNAALSGGALGFYETWINGRRAIGHGGDTVFFHTQMLLVPEENLGVFVSFNTDNAGFAAVDIARAVVKHVVPAELPVVKVRVDAKERNARYAGSYRALRQSYTKAEKVFAAFGDFSVAAMPDGTLMLRDILEAHPTKWVEVGEGVFRQQLDDTFIAFVGGEGDAGGKATHMVGPFAPIAFARVAWYESPVLHGVLIAIGVALFISMLVSAIRRRKADRAGTPQLRWARWALAAAGVLLIGFLIGVVISVAGGIEELIFGFPTAFYVALALPLLALLPTVLAIYYAVQLWRNRAWTLGARVHYSVALVSVLLFFLVLNYWNLIGYRLG